MRMSDRDVVEQAARTSSGDKFRALYNGGTLYESEERNEKSLMKRIAVFCDGDEKKLLRIFRSSGQYRDEKPNSFYEKLAAEATDYVAKLKVKEDVPIFMAGGQKAGLNAKT